MCKWRHLRLMVALLIFSFSATGQDCKANYGLQHNSTALTYYFTDSSKAASGDNIISRYWSWGDGSSTQGNITNPSHTFPRDSVYNVCLKITTQTGCYSYSCKTIGVGSAGQNCYAYYGWHHATNNPREFHFYDSSKIATGDSIIQRYWSWGDGTFTDGNLKNPTHTFPKDSTYNVCERISTRSGCYSYSCQKITVVTGNTTCTANYGWQHNPNSSEYHFYDSSKAVIGDSIISRYWFWGDGSSTDGNLKNLAHNFLHDSTYNVCLKIITKTGCYSYSCKLITVVTGNTTCTANYGWQHAIFNPLEFHFYDSSKAVPGDSIISRYWFWGDGSSTTDGNQKNPTHIFRHDSTYNVCLKIITKSGCYSYSCKLITVITGNTTCFANYGWRPATNNLLEIYFSDSSKTVPGDSIISLYWFWGDGSSTTDGNLKNTYHVFQKDSTYNVCLKITTKTGCYSYSCQKITITGNPQKCVANYSWHHATNNLKEFYFSDSSKAAPGDSIISRLWYWGDGNSTDGNIKNPTHVFIRDTTYNVCLKITTKMGCYSYSCQKITITGNPQTCVANYSWHHATNNLKEFYFSDSSKAAPGDSIISRYWFWGDGSSTDGNIKNPTHVFTRDSTYNICLKITTKTGCFSYSCKLVTVANPTQHCGALFTFENTGSKKLQFNSTASYSQLANDYIINRYWTFGDGATLGGNEISPSHEYRMAGTYTACLNIVTKENCESRWCHLVKVDGNTWSDSENIKLLNVYPNPVHGTMYAVVWSNHNNVQAQLAIYDVYGILKWSKQVILPQGMSVWPVPTGNLLAGPYVFRLTTQYGVHHKNFQKLN